jgi:hypothetical protein
MTSLWAKIFLLLQFGEKNLNSLFDLGCAWENKEKGLVKIQKDQLAIVLNTQTNSLNQFFRNEKSLKFESMLKDPDSKKLFTFFTILQ